MTAIRVLIGEMLTGRIRVTLEGNELPTGLRWTDVLNGGGSIDGVTIPEAVVRKYDLKQHTHEWRCFLAVEVDDRIKQAGPIVTRPWDPVKGEVTLGAKGLWGWLDRQVIYPLGVMAPFATQGITISGKSLGGIARGLVAPLALSPYTQVPIVLPPDEAGEHTETFWMYQLLDVGEQLRQLTQRATDAPDIRFVPRRRADDPRFLEWVMLVGTVDRPALYQAGPDWVFDASAPKSPVLRIGADSDGNDMAEFMWATGNGQEQGTVMTVAFDVTLLNAASPWPLTHGKISRPAVEDEETLLSHATNEVKQSGRPIEVWKVAARVESFNEVAPGDYCRTVTVGDAWYGDMDVTTRISAISGGLSDELQFDMFPVQAVL